MQKFQLLIILTFLSSCCNEPLLLKNGLTEKANKITSYSIKVDYDSTGVKRYDTISIDIRLYNEKDLIIKRIQNTLFDNETMEVDFIYNNEKIQNEIVRMSNDSTQFEVQYNYEDMILNNTFFEKTNNEYNFKQIGTYKYRSNQTLNEISTTQIFIDQKNKDTISHSLKIESYNNDERLVESEVFNYSNPERNTTTKYNYKCGILTNFKKYNQNDSLISNLKYKYKYDSHNNWIERESKENNKLISKLIREIEYR